jgi:hypothetical protein
MQKTLEFEELKDNWQLFENLVADYFSEVKVERRIESIEVEPSGEGPDGGRDILLTFRFTDSISTFTRKWVVQCKFRKNSIQKKDLLTVNIPSLIHQHGADGYLLVCRRDVGALVRQMFRDLNDNCRFSYDYKIWTGSEFKSKIIQEGELVQKYFPEYWTFLQKVSDEKDLERL